MSFRMIYNVGDTAKTYIPTQKDVHETVTKQEVPKEAVKEVPKEVVKEVPKEVIKEVIKEVPKEVIKEVPKEVIKEVIKEVPKEVIKEVCICNQNKKSILYYNKQEIKNSSNPVLIFPYDGSKNTLRSLVLCFDFQDPCLIKVTRLDNSDVLSEIEFPSSGFTVFELDRFKSLPKTLTALELSCCLTQEEATKKSYVISVEINLD